MSIPEAPVPTPPVARPGPTVPRAPGAPDRALEDAVDRLEATSPEDLDAVLSAGTDAHRALQERLGQTGG